MEYKELLKWLKATALAFVIYFAFTAFYFAPQLSNKTLAQSDIRQYKGMSEEINRTRESVGEDPQWSGALFSGMPAYLISIDYPAQIIKAIGGAATSLVGEPQSFILFAMLSMFLMLIMMGVPYGVAIVGGALYGLSTYFMLIIEAGHLTKMWALCYAPIMLGAIFMTLRGDGRNIYLGAALTALFTSLQIAANHPQITYYFLMAAAALWLSELYYSYKEGKLKALAKSSALLLTAGIFALLSNLAPLWYIAEHTPDTIRGGSELAIESSSNSNGGLDMEYATAWSYGISESLNLLIPDFMGRSSMDTLPLDGKSTEVLKPYNAESIVEQLPAYWGGQPFTSGPTYIGAVVLFLAAIGIGLSRGRDRWWIIAISILMLLLSWGDNMMWFTELMFKILPGYNKFRTVSMTLVVVELTAPLLAAYGLAALWRNDDTESKRVLKVIGYAAAATAGVALFIMVVGGAIFDFGRGAALQLLLDNQFPEELATPLSEAMAEDRVGMMQSDALRSILYILIAGATIVAYTMRRIGRWVMLCIVGIVATIDLTTVDLRFLSHDDFVTPSQAQIYPSQANKIIIEDKGESGDSEYRVYNSSVSTFNDATTSYFHRSIGGYHGAKLARYQDLIENYLASGYAPVLDMLNVRYQITSPTQVTERSTALGAAWFIDGVELVEGAQQEIERIGKIDLSRYAVVAQADKEIAQISGVSSNQDEIVMESYLPHYQKYRYNSSNDRVAIFSEIYYPKGWSLYIDGKESPYFRANYILRGATLPAGEHIVEWRFRAPRWRLIEGITLLCSIAILAALVMALGYIFKIDVKLKTRFDGNKQEIES